MKVIPPPENFPLSRALADSRMREGGTFWRDVFAIQQSVGPVIVWRWLFWIVWAFGVSLLHRYQPWEPAETSVVEVTGAFLAMLLVLRSNSGYDRWWEARRLWGGFVNQGRNLVVTALAFGPRDDAWRRIFVRWAAAFAHVCRRSLRGEREMPEVVALIGEAAAARVLASPHGPTYTAHVLAELIADAHRSGHINTAIYRQLELQRTLLVEHVGHCERIVSTRFPRVHRTMLGQLMVLYLLAFPFAVVSDGWWGEAFLMAPIAYFLLSLDQVARELGNPFSPNNRSHLPIGEIAAALEQNLMGLLDQPVHLDALPLLPKKE